MTRSFLRAFLVFILVSVLALAGTANFGVVQVSAQAPGVIVIIGSDTTWTKADSPHNLTGPLLVMEGVTLTIEAGTTVNLNGYEVLVNGTLRAIGSSTDLIHFNGGNITFTEYSNGWNEQTGSGCIIENTILDVSEISSSVSLKITNCIINGEITVGASSVILNNTITGRHFSSTTSLPYAIDAGDLSIISNNTITGTNAQGQVYALSYDLCYALSVDGSCVISNNNVIGDVIGGSSVISNNTITGRVKGSSSVISNNIITGTIGGVSSTISNNTIAGGEPTYDWGGRSDDPTSAINIRGESSVVSNNIITSPLGGYGITIREGYTYVSGNIISDSITGIRAAGDSTIDGNLITNNGHGIAIGHIVYYGFTDRDIGVGNVVIRNNTIANNPVGIGGGGGGSAMIERNLITNSSHGIDAGLPVTILNNTISNTGVAIRLDSCPSVTIIYNNFENYGENSIYLEGTSSNIDATNNWWGTADTQAINLSIRDYKYEFGLGKVTFIPFLTEPNTEATSNPIPEFPSWVILPLLLTVTLLIILCKRRLP